MPTLIAVVTADCSTEQLAAFLQYALRPGSEHVYGSNDTTLEVGTVTVDTLEVRHPDGEHYRDNETGEFTSETDAEARPDETSHEAAE